jgi:NCS1 family nucleobase:cation symporter-1
MSVCIPTSMLASGLIAEGMNWIQAILTILLGNLIVLIPMLLNAHAGTKYSIPFPVFVRASFGVRGANVPAIKPNQVIYVKEGQHHPQRHL